LQRVNLDIKLIYDRVNQFWKIKLAQKNYHCYNNSNFMLTVIQIILSLPLIVAILLQAKGAGLSGVFGGEGNVYRTKRGAEKTLFIFTIVIAVLFFSVALLNVIFVEL